MINELGKVEIAESVIATIASIAATSTNGVVGLSGGFVDGVLDIARKTSTKGIKIEKGDTEVAIDINIVVEYGMNIAQVTKQVQMGVYDNVNIMTGYKVVEVNVKVDGVHIKEDEKPLPKPQPRVN